MFACNNLMINDSASSYLRSLARGSRATVIVVAKVRDQPDLRGVI